MQTYPEFYPYFAEREFTWNKIRQQNRNPLLAMGIGADGLKTGETGEAGFDLVGSAVEDGFRLIVVVTGAKSEKERAEEARKLLDWGFHGFESKLPVRRGPDRRRGQGLRRQHELRSARRARHRPGDDAAQQQRADFRAASSTPGRCRPRSTKGQTIGKLKVWRGENLALEVPLKAAEDVGPGSMRSAPWMRRPS